MKKSFLILSLSALSLGAFAQEVTYRLGGQIDLPQTKKTTEQFNFVANGTSYFVSYYFDAGLRHYHMDAFDASGQNTMSTDLKYAGGVLNNSWDIHSVFGIGGKPYAMVEYIDKPAGLISLKAHAISSTGEVSPTGVQLMQYPFEKTMNSGNNEVCVSPDGMKIAVISTLPFDKAVEGKLKVSVFDGSLKAISEGEVTIPGENTKNKRITGNVANDGTVYITDMRTTSKEGKILHVFQYDASSSKMVNDYDVKVDAGNRIDTYASGVNDKGEFFICGTYFIFKNLVVGYQKMDGLFYFTNPGKGEGMFKMIPLDAPVESLVARKIVFGTNTLFLAVEQMREEKIAPTSGTASSFDYTYVYHHGKEGVIGIDSEGNKKFELYMDQEFKATNNDQLFQSAYYLVNGKFTMVYNDLYSKYRAENESLSMSYMPLLVQVTEDGLMTAPFQLREKSFTNGYFQLVPTYGLQPQRNELGFLIQSGGNGKFITLSVK